MYHGLLLGLEASHAVTLFRCFLFVLRSCPSSGESRGCDAGGGGAETRPGSSERIHSCLLGTQ